MRIARIARITIIPKMRILLVVLLISQIISRTSLLSSSGVIPYNRLDLQDRISEDSPAMQMSVPSKAKAADSGPV